MGIIINLDVVMAQRKKGLTELAKDVDITLANLSILKNSKGHPPVHTQCYLQVIRLPARRYFTIYRGAGIAQPAVMNSYEPIT